MKTFVTSMIVLLVLLVGIGIYSIYIDGVMQKIEKCVENISESAYKKEWSICKERIKELLEVWRKNEPVLAMFNDHEDVDNIEIAIGKLKENVLHENYENTFHALTETKILLERIKKNETFTLENVLKATHFGVVGHNML